MTENRERVYDVALSFAGEDRPYVGAVAKALVGDGVKVFYDEYQKVTLWGKNLYEHLRKVYQDEARYTVVFISQHYARKLWTKHERESAQARAFRENAEYILPVRFDDTEIPGLLDTISYIDLRDTSPTELASLILEKLGRRPGTWEGPPVIVLPNETQPPRESLRERAARLARRYDVNKTRTQVLESSEGLRVAQQEVARLKQYLKEEVEALNRIAPSLNAVHMTGNDGVQLVRTRRASFTMYWQQPYSNTLNLARLFTREFDGPYSLGAREVPSDDTHVAFDVDETLKPGWRDEREPSFFLTSEQLVDKYLSRVIERAFSVEDASKHDEPVWLE